MLYEKTKPRTKAIDFEIVLTRIHYHDQFHLPALSMVELKSKGIKEGNNLPRKRNKKID